MNNRYLILLALIMAFTACKKNNYDVTNIDKVDLSISTKFGTAADTTYINLKTKLAINTANFSAGVLYTQVSPNEVNLKVPTSHSNKFFQFDWLLSDNETAHFGITKKDVTTTVTYGL